MDLFRSDGQAGADAKRRVVEMLEAARASSGSGDALPKVLKPSHASMALAMARGCSIQEVADFSGLSVRSCERYRYSPALRLVVTDLQRLYYDSKLAEGQEVLYRAVPDAINTLIEASRLGNITAAREVLRLTGGKTNNDSRSSPDLAHTQPDYTTPNPAPSLKKIYTTPPATLGKAEEHPSPDPEYLRSIAPMWTTQPIKENDDAPLHTE